MLVVHHLGLSQSDRIVWLCEELGLDYQLQRYERDPQSRMAPPEYKALTPFGTAPVITDGDLVLGESGAIMDYIIHTHGEGRLAVEPGDPGYAEYLFWFHFANASMIPAAMVKMIAVVTGGDPTRLGAMATRLDLAYNQIEARLGLAPYFAGQDFSAADIIMVFPLTTMRVFAPHDLAPFPNIRSYLQRISKRPAFRRAMDKADPGFQMPLD